MEKMLELESMIKDYEIKFNDSENTNKNCQKYKGEVETLKVKFKLWKSKIELSNLLVTQIMYPGWIGTCLWKPKIP
jgi:hypothetical protein